MGVALPSSAPNPVGRPRWSRIALVTIAALYVGILLLAPLAGIAWTVVKGGLHVVSETFRAPDVRHAYFLTFLITVLTVIVTGVMGVVVALVLARDRFVGRRVVSAVVDLPLAVSPVIVGLAAVLLFGRGGWFENFFAARGIQILFALPSMVLVTIFICIPFVVREVVPVLQELGTEEEDAARTLGASASQTFLRITLPNIRWGLLYGVALSAARAMGEIGAVLIVSGTLQGKTETATLYIFRALEERQEPSGYLVALTLAGVSVLLLAAIEIFKRRRIKEIGR
jgi:sulfate transport system permease protein